MKRPRAQNRQIPSILYTAGARTASVIFRYIVIIFYLFSERFRVSMLGVFSRYTYSLFSVDAMFYNISGSALSQTCTRFDKKQETIKSKYCKLNGQ